MPRNRAPAMALYLGHVRLPGRFTKLDTLILSTVWLSKINRHNRLEREAAEAEATLAGPEVGPTRPPMQQAPIPQTALVVWQPSVIAAFTKA